MVLQAASGAPAMAEDSLSALARLKGEREAIARALIEPVSACVTRHDTNYPAFHGCIDWHSAVHGTWALIAYSRATGDRRYDALVRDTILSTANIAAERRDLAKRPAFEMPYGRAWFLRLAIDYEKAFGDGRLAPMAEDVARSLLARFDNSTPDPNATEYDSDSWVLLNLMDYARFTKDAALTAAVEKIALELVDVSTPCDPKLETGGFMAVCTNRAALTAKILPRSAFIAWANDFFAHTGALAPVANPAGAHENGLDFSRAWGFWEIYAATGDPHYAKAYVSHFNANYGDPTRWRGDYHSVAHWVAQFGFYALQPLFGSEKGR